MTAADFFTAFFVLYAPIVTFVAYRQCVRANEAETAAAESRAAADAARRDNRELEDALAETDAVVQGLRQDVHDLSHVPQARLSEVVVEGHWN